MDARASTQARILVVDDQAANVLLLKKILARAGYTNIEQTTDAREVTRLYVEFGPDLILLDLHMPHIEGLDLLEQLNSLIPEDTFLPILVLTADATPAARQSALSAGAKDFLTKPFDATEVMLRIRNLIQTRLLHLQLNQEKGSLAEKVRERTVELENAQMETMDRLALAAEYRDDDTGQHTQRVGRTAALVARELSLASVEVDVIRRAAPLHDVGKIGISDSILLKPGRLTAEEFEVVKSHTTIGAGILSGGGFPILQLAEEIALMHHERWDGSGYPHGLQGDSIPLAGRIVSVVDVFDALTHDRPYKSAWSVADALKEIEGQAGRQFDPRVVEAFLRQSSAIVSGGGKPLAITTDRA